jgi:hypothetical protein
VIGNGSIKSGAIKLVGGLAAKKFLGGSLGNMLSLGFSVDGVEDILMSFLGGFGTTGGGENW